MGCAATLNTDHRSREAPGRLNPTRNRFRCWFPVFDRSVGVLSQIVFEELSHLLGSRL
jgi:hypothetical protein